MFWKLMLPRLQYHNPSVPISVTRTADQAGPSTLSIFLRDSPNSSASSPPAAAAPSSADTTTVPLRASAAEVLTIDMKNKSEDDILAEFMEVSGATRVVPTASELLDLGELEQQKEKSTRDSERSKKVRAQWKKEQAMLSAAREGAA
jgi:large subunit ribosomal protein MRP49